MILPQFYVDDVIKRAISEDINYIDVATDYLLDENEKSKAKFIAKADGVLCGIEVAMRVFSLLDEEFTYTLYQKDGENVKKGDTVAILYASDKKRLQAGAELFAKAIKITTAKPKPYKLIQEIIK